MGYIYKITNIINNKIYIGLTRRNIKVRFNEHIKKAKLNYNTKLYNAINKYGENNFKIEVIEQIDNELLSDREIFWIKYYNSVDNTIGYNSTLGGDGCNTLKYIDTDKYLERNKKISNALKGRKQDQLIIDKRVKKLLGKKRTKEQKQLMSIKQKGKITITKDNKVKRVNKNLLNNYLNSGWIKGSLKVSTESKNKISKSLTGKKQDKSTKEKRSQTMSKLKWFNNGFKQIRALECPNNFSPGRLKSKYNKKSLEKSSHKGLHVFNNGKINIMASSCPIGFQPGRINKLKKDKKLKKEIKKNILNNN